MSHRLGLFLILLTILIASSNVFGQLSADFDVIIVSQCPPGIINVVNKSTGFTACEWVFGNGNSSISTLDTLNQVYPNAGNYTISLKISNGEAEQTVSKSIRIFKEPKAAFTTNISEGCIPMSVTFTEASAKGDAEIESYYWDFRNGVLVQNENPTLNYTTSGEYDVLLKVTDANGCIDFVEKENFIKAHPQPDADFTASPMYSCSIPITVSLTNHSTSEIPVNYLWSFGNGESSTDLNTSTDYTQSGSYSIKLKTYNGLGCVDSLSKTVVMEESIVSDFSITSASGEIINDSDTICPGLYKLENLTIPAGTMHWIINGNNFIFSDSTTCDFNKNGWNTIRLEPNLINGCLSAIEKRVYVDGIRADFAITDVTCNFPLTVDFINNTADAVSFRWKLAQGNTSTDEHAQIILKDIYQEKDYIDAWPVYRYQNTLIVTNEHGCVDSLTKNIDFKHPKAQIIADIKQGCVPLEINFTDTSTSTPDISERIWIFDDGNTITNDEKHYSHTYTVAGDYSAKIIAVNEMNCRDTSEIFEINAGTLLNPSFDFSPKIACYNDSIQFHNTTSNSPVVDRWSYSSTANFMSICENDPNPRLPLYARSSGYHDVTLEVDYNGCVSSTTYKDALYIRGPVSSFTYSTDCINPTQVSFTGNFELASGFEWNFADGSVNTTEPNPLKKYINSDDYNVVLTSYNDTTGCEYVFKDNINIRQLKADFSVDTIACVGEIVELDATASTDYMIDCYDEPFIWKISDNPIVRKTHRGIKQRIFDNRGVYSATLIAKDINGCFDTITKNIHVLQPDPSFTVDSVKGCAPNLNSTFINTSTDPSIKNFCWNFGDGSLLNDVDTVLHTYNSTYERWFAAYLTATDTVGCINEVSKTLSVFKPSADFTTTDFDICTGNSLTFNRFYSSADSSYWQFGEGDFSNQPNNYVFNQPGTFSVYHKIFKDHCTDSVSKKNYISVEEASAKIIASDTIAECYPQTILLNHINEGDPVISGSWDFDFKGHSSPGYSDSVYFSYSLPGEFYPTLSIRTKNGCTDSEQIKITVKGPYAELIISDKTPCKTQPVTFSMSNQKDVSEQLWDFGDGLASENDEPEYTYNQIDDFIVSLTISDINGCTPPAKYDTVYVKQIISDFSFTNNDTLICAYETIAPSNNSTGGDLYTWKVNEKVISNNPVLTGYSLSEPGQYRLALEVYDNEYCSDTSFQTFRIFPLPEIAAYGPDSICREVELAQLGVETDSAWSVLWTPGYCIDDPAAFTINATPEISTVFVVKVTDTINCISSDEVDVYVHQFPEIFRNPASDTTILLGEELSLLVGSTNKSVYAWNGKGEGTLLFSDTLTVIPEESSVYTVSIKDHCFENLEEFVVNVREIYTIELPDVFTPNGDGINDIIYVKGGGIKELISFNVFNRYGNLVYSSDDIDLGWDGYYNDKLQNADIYTYFVKVLTFEDEIVESQGSFNLMY